MLIRPAASFAVTIFLILILINPAKAEYSLATNKEELILISQEKEISMGKSIAKQVETKFKEDTNYTNQEKVALIGQRLAAVCDRKDLIFYFTVLDEKDTENAFALPGGYVYIFKALLEKLDDDEIAAILAHEIGHVCAKHTIKRLQAGLGYQVLQILVMRGAEDNYTRRKAYEAFAQLMLAYSRSDEFEADALAIKYLRKAGIDQKAMLRVLDKLIKWQMEKPTTPKRYWYTHPYLSARRSTVNQQITGQINFDDYINITDDEDYIIE
jgi:predicted Zn-dependent protease